MPEICFSMFVYVAMPRYYWLNIFWSMETWIPPLGQHMAFTFPAREIRGSIQRPHWFAVGISISDGEELNESDGWTYFREFLRYPNKRNISFLSEFVPGLLQKLIVGLRHKFLYGLFKKTPTKNHSETFSRDFFSLSQSSSVNFFRYLLVILSEILWTIPAEIYQSTHCENRSWIY